jgi:hypothetical protein
VADDQLYAAAIVAVSALLFGGQVLARRFDPFAPVWLFLVGFVQVYAIQATTLRDWALNVRGLEVVTAANFRALWAVLWFLAAYYSGLGNRIAPLLPAPPGAWSAAAVVGISPFLVAWGAYSTYLLMNLTTTELTPDQTIVLSFPFVTMVGGVLLIVTGRDPSAPKPAVLAAGLAVVALFTLVWMYNGKRSPALVGVLSAVCAFYAARRRRPSWPVLLATAFVGSLFVAVAIGWRNNPNYDRSVSGFVQYLGDFEVSSILKSLNVDNDEENLDPLKFHSFETLEYGGFLLMLDTVPEKSDYDYGANYVRIVSTFIPRLLWAEKPLYGRDKWVGAWIAGSELKRDEDFTGPSIAILGATQLNGGAVGTAVVLAVVATFLRTAYEYFRLHEAVPWVQAWWSLFYYNAWYAVVADDPANWFYYNWGFTCMPTLAFLWLLNKFLPAPAREALAPAGA